MSNQQGTGQKHDGGKILAACLFEYFPDALMDVAEVATYGANKYVRNGWKDVPEKETRYADAYFRHILHNYMGEERDEESGLRHKAHAAWNALALLQMEIEKQEEEARAQTQRNVPYQGGVSNFIYAKQADECVKELQRAPSSVHYTPVFGKDG